MRNLVKCLVVGLVATCSLHIASTRINQMVIEVNQREKTIADVIIEQQVQEIFKEAEQEIIKVQQEEEVTIQAEEVMIKPPLPEKEDKPKKEEVVKEELVKEEILEGEGAIEDLEVQDKEADSLETLETLQELTSDHMVQVGDYLITHYFLYGYEYYQKETDPVLYTRKKLASDMEDQIIASVQVGLTLLKDLKTLDADKFRALREDIMLLAEGFKETYEGIQANGEEFTAIYESGQAFFESYIGTLEKGEAIFEQLKQTTNPVLILPVLLKQINEELLPGIKDVLNQGFNLKEKTNPIYIEGIDASFLITPEEVMQIIANPYRVLENDLQQDPSS